ncbi:phosphoadenosine phosphosulfate reductase family protein [Paenibacillus sp. PDC88]|uniref:Phosphoadenosine phosphosulfate reductase family protein n=1 Tax=Paenibacillus provencensis TaxID=441151 RepID=A0ABW3Q7E8_9BACL|nr:phosphoadenosine phosphosulfate reductase family protein [Paenibacillus sp. PDC88]SDX63461.1 DNA sulfur modification protein DndC [Paenibacillus sp. PDC88]
METYELVENTTKIGIQNRLKDYNSVILDTWDYLEAAGFSFHGVVRDWTAIFEKGVYFAIHHFVKDQPDLDCIAPDSGFSWKDIFQGDSVSGALFLFLEKSGFNLWMPEQAAIDALVATTVTDDSYMFGRDIYPSMSDWSYTSPKHKFQVYGFHRSGAVLIEIYALNIPPYGASKDPLPFPEDRCQPSFDIFDLATGASQKRKQRAIAGETLDFLEKVDDELLAVTRAKIKKIYDEHSIIGLLNSGGVDSRLTLQLMIEHAIKNPDPSKRIMVISADTLVENPGVKQIIHELRDALGRAFPWIEYHIVEPREDNTLLVCIIGKGYQAPSVSFKYCVRRLKIEPAREFLEAMFLADGAEDTVLVLGSRDNESVMRKRSLSKHFGEDFYGHHPVGNIRTASPIRDWTKQEVVTYLAFNRGPWKKGARNTELLAFYGNAAGSECPLGAAVVNDNEAMMQCGKSARMGCYLCTISQDKSMGNLISTHPEYEKYYKFRRILKAIGQDIRYGGITGVQRIGKSKIGSGIGDLTIDCRTHLLQAMARLDIEWRKSEIITAYQMVLEREMVEGFPVTERFRDAIFQLIAVSGSMKNFFGHSVFDPYGTGVDQVTEEDNEAIKRVLEKRRNMI